MNHAAPTQTAFCPDESPLAAAVAPAAFLLGGVPTLTVFVMTAVRYVAHGTF